MRLTVALSLALLGVAGCSDSASKNDGGNADDAFIPVSCPEGVDPSIDPETAIVVAEGQQQQGQICPQRDVDFYKVTIPAGKSLLKIDLTHPGPTQVELTYRLLKAQAGGGTVGVGSAPAGKTNNYVGALHCLGPGDYYVVVQDSGDDAADGKKRYTFSYTTEADLDKNEPNDDEATAKAINGPVTGYISCTGDQDFYTVTTGVGELLDISLTTAKTTPVDLKYTLYLKEGKNLKAIASSTVGDGTKKPTELETIYPTPGAGTYYLVVQDDGDDDSDAATPYTLTISKRPEPDTNDKPARNDHPKTATALGDATGAESCASPKTFTRNGHIASIADVDVYEIAGPATLPAGAPPVIEIEVKFSGATKVDPAVSLLIPDPATSCTEDRCCQVLGGADGSCGSVYDCSASSFACVTRSQEFCNECISGADPTCAQKKSCAGAVTCLKSSQCGYSQFNRSAKDGSTLRIAQPIMAGGPWYVRVADLGGDEYDYGVSYTLTVKICADPDGAKEPDGGYFPRLVAFPNKAPEKDSAEFTSESVEDFFENEGTQKARGAVTIPKDGSFSAPITGHISYEHDEDHILITNPCPNKTCQLLAEYATKGSCPGNGGTLGAGLEFVYLLEKGSGRDGFPSAQTLEKNGTFGFTGASGPCAILLRENSSDQLRLVVGDRFHNNWSWSCTYSIRFKIANSGCPVPPCALSSTNECYVP